MLITGIINIVLATQVPAPVTIESLETELKAIQTAGQITDIRAAIRLADRAVQFANDPGCKTAESMRRVATLIAGGESEYRLQRVRYELALCATALGDAEATKLLASSWDRLMISMGQPMRLNAEGWVKRGTESYYRLNLAPKAITDVLLRKTKSVVKTDNAEVKKIVDADQAARQGDWSKMTEKQMIEMAEQDVVRQKRIKEIIKRGDLHTAHDFASASLVLQHSDRFEGYQLAHELALCSLTLGDRSLGRWLTAATYDRMLRSLGHDQRFGTQYNMTGHCFTDEYGINDEQRAALGCPSLEKARKVKLD